CIGTGATTTRRSSIPRSGWPGRRRMEISGVVCRRCIIRLPTKTTRRSSLPFGRRAVPMRRSGKPCSRFGSSARMASAVLTSSLRCRWFACGRTGAAVIGAAWSCPFIAGRAKVTVRGSSPFLGPASRIKTVSGGCFCHCISSRPMPLVHFWADRGAEDHGSSVFPLYWHQRRNGDSQFLSWLWFSHANPDGDSRRLLPPLFYQESTKTSSTLITPFWAQGHSETNDWRAVIPLCYWDRRQHVLLSPLWARWRSGESETWLAPWSLSWNTRSPERDDLTLLGGFARASWGEKPGPGYVFPLFYRDPAEGTLLSPLWLRWRN